MQREKSEDLTTVTTGNDADVWLSVMILKKGTPTKLVVERQNRRFDRNADMS